MVGAATVGTHMDRGRRNDAPDISTAANEPVCDMCGTKTSMLRKHNKGMVCWSCKASTVKD